MTVWEFWACRQDVEEWRTNETKHSCVRGEWSLYSDQAEELTNTDREVVDWARIVGTMVWEKTHIV